MKEQNERLKQALRHLIRCELEEVYYGENLFYLVRHMMGYSLQDTRQLCDDLGIDVEMTVGRFLGRQGYE